ncbi:MAG: hypothetical protein EOP84_26640, partial [Verrucomicrobiaceae bacterium]
PANTCRLGRRVVRLKVPGSKRQYTVHEDLLCSHSKTFKARLQKSRKSQQDECSICTEALDDRAQDLTFCRDGCGQNFHEECIDDWKKSQNGPMKCPMCRKLWKDSPPPPGVPSVVSFTSSAGHFLMELPYPKLSPEPVQPARWRKARWQLSSARVA